MEETLEAWFKKEVLPHEKSLTRFLSRRWRDVVEISDVRQEAYIRVLEAARRTRPTSPKAFLFTIARNLLTDQLRRRRALSMRPLGSADEPTEVLVDELSPEQRVSDGSELMRVLAALNRLPTRCREVVWLRRLEDYSQRETAERLGISEKAVEKHVHLGMQRLAKLTSE